MTQGRQTAPSFALVATDKGDTQPELAPPVLRTWDDMVADGFSPRPVCPERAALTQALQSVADAQARRFR